MNTTDEKNTQNNRKVAFDLIRSICVQYQKNIHTPNK